MPDTRISEQEEEEKDGTSKQVPAGHERESREDAEGKERTPSTLRERRARAADKAWRAYYANKAKS